MVIVTKNNVIQKYCINILKIDFDYGVSKSGLLANLGKYMIKTENKKENLSSNIDEILYGK